MNTDSNIRHQNLRNMSVLHLFYFPIFEGIDPALWMLPSQRIARKNVRIFSLFCEDFFMTIHSFIMELTHNKGR